MFVGMVRNTSFLINAKSKSHSDSLLTFVMVTVYRRLCENCLSSRWNRSDIHQIGYQTNHSCQQVQYDLTTLEEQNCNLSQIEIDKMLCLMGHVASKISSNNDMPTNFGVNIQCLVSTLQKANPDDCESFDIISTHQVGLYFLSNSLLMNAATSCWEREGKVTV